MIPKGQPNHEYLQRSLPMNETYELKEFLEDWLKLTADERITVSETLKSLLSEREASPFPPASTGRKDK